MQRHNASRTSKQQPADRRACLLLLSGLFLLAAPGTTLPAQTRVDSRSADRASIDAHVAEAARRFGIPAAWIRAVMRVESAGDRAAVSPKGAMGLMQIMPATWAYLRSRHALGADPFDPRDNILAGAAYLRELHDRYGAPGFLAAYNAGPGRYEASLSGRPLPAETIAYVATLTPAIDGQTAPLTERSTVVDPQAWRSAALFVSRAAGHNDVRTGTASESYSDAATMPTNAEVATASPPRESLFVSRQRTEEAP